MAWRMQSAATLDRFQDDVSVGCGVAGADEAGGVGDDFFNGWGFSQIFSCLSYGFFLLFAQ